MCRACFLYIIYIVTRARANVNGFSMQSDEKLQQGKDLYFRIECDLGIYPSKHDEKEEILKKREKN